MNSEKEEVPSGQWRASARIANLMPKAGELRMKIAFLSASVKRGRCAETCGRICGCRLRRSSFLLLL